VQLIDTINDNSTYNDDDDHDDEDGFIGGLNPEITPKYVHAPAMKSSNAWLPTA